MYCWGNNRSRQLGLIDKEEEAVDFTENDYFTNQVGVQKVACGGRHTLFLQEDGIVLSCGQNDCEQLGRRTDTSSLGQIHSLEAQTIVDVSCGSNHSVAICSDRNIFTWGGGSQGQLGLGQFPQNSRIPRKITVLSDIRIIQISCGHFHTVALSEDCNVFSWGKNDFGQLGLGKQMPNQAIPQVVKSLKGVPLLQVSAGGSQSFALSMSGIVFGWGKNNAGQIGLESDPLKAGVFKPYPVSSLRDKGVIYISCGDEHTAVLSKEGTVYTFGDGTQGQLGKSSITHTSVPQKIEEYERQVSQIACGSYHTLLYVLTSNQIVSFGHGIQVKLDDHLPEVPLEPDIVFTSKDLKDISLKQIFAGNNVSFATSTLQPQRFVERGYHLTNKHEEKEVIITSVRTKLYLKHGKKYDKEAIQKKFCDLKRLHPELVKEYSERLRPGVPVPSLRQRISKKKVVAATGVKEESAEQAEEDQPGPSQPGDSSPPPPEERDMEVYTPNQEVIRKLKRRLLEHRKTEAKAMLAIKAEKKNIGLLQAWLHRHQRQLDDAYKKLEEQRKMHNEELLEIQQELQSLP
ncbi:probable E3 ubiquitin-protein ligase HERC6 isoform X3 [Bufo gargarizans]|uniref:probable E3 ubiquitin-protein ligase HERC6 isoform X3 n=1 Tax=Bufo gargarizans TaxID=30331 RepID=UPI001CF3CF37|nr:probable E3 ubiquitin-protein ligase HERC6 isoform X3 [Bufo gargarizans]